MRPRAYESAPNWPGVEFLGNVSPYQTTLGRVAEWQTLGT